MLMGGNRDFPGPRVQPDMRPLPIKDSSLDGIWANASPLHLRADQFGIALKEFLRVLNSSGTLHLSLKLGSGSLWDTDRYLEPRWFQYWSEPELDDVLSDAVFEAAAGWVAKSSRSTWIVRHLRKRA